MDEFEKLLKNAGLNESDAFGDKGSYWDKKREKGEGYVAQESATKRPEESVIAEISAMLWNYADGDPYIVDAVMEKVHAQLLQMQIKHNKNR